MIFLFIALGICIVIYLKSNADYKKTEYYNQTKIPLLVLRFDKGRYGEYLTYKYLSKLSGHKQYLFNCYIPKDNNTTTELDVILLHDSGIYIFESKNYSGWIFGTETHKYWTQTLPAGGGKTKKSHFLNPIIQNKGHIKWLQKYVGQEDLPMYSFVIFSDRCTLKNINLTSNTHWVINRYEIMHAVSSNASKVGQKLTVAEIDSIYEKLYPLTQITEKQKNVHVQQIRKTVTELPSICPKCGATLVRRTAKKGSRAGKDFLGCSNYPKCRYVKNIDN